MKTLTVTFMLLLFLVTNAIFGQEYTFDKTVKSKFTTQNFPNQEHTYLFNSKDYFSYQMQIYSRNDSLIARIFDKKEAKRHIFYMDKTDSLRPVFIKTEVLKRNDDIYTYEYSKFGKEDEVTLINFTVKGKRKKATYAITLEKSDENYFPLYSNAGGLEELFYTDVKPPFNCKVLKAEGKNLSGNYTKYELVSISDVTLYVVVPPQKSTK